MPPMNNEPQAVSIPVHEPMSQFAVADGELLIGAIPISRLLARVGKTPFYAYDRRLIAERAESLRQALPPSLCLHYAMKANPMPALVGWMTGLVDGVDVASLGEMKVALDAGVGPERISFAGPGKRDEELRAAVAAGVLLNVESEHEVAVLANISDKLALPARIAVRVNPDFELKSSGMKMGGGAKPFGVDAEQVPSLLRRIAGLGLAFEGFHVFAGSQNLKAEAITDAQQQAMQLVRRLIETAPPSLPPVRSINLGGGFGIPYFPGEKRLDITPIADNLAQLVAQASLIMPKASLHIELGRYLVGEAGVYVTSVVDKKVSRGETFLVVDGGLNHHLAASGNFGQVIRKNYPVAIGNRMAETNLETVSIVGPLCTPLDRLADKVSLPKAEIDDLVVIFQSGAYGASASPQGFLGHPPVTEVLV